MAMPILPFTFSLPIMKAVVGSRSPLARAWKFAIVMVMVQSASASSFDTVLLLPSTNTMPSSPKSNFTVAFRPLPAATRLAMVWVICSSDIVSSLEM